MARPSPLIAAVAMVIINEAILACLAIVVWHFYHVIFDPDVYPINWAAWDGRVSKHCQEDEHPLEELSAESAPVVVKDKKRETSANNCKAKRVEKS